MPDPARFLRRHLPPVPVAGTGIALHLAQPGSGLRRLVAPGGAPYWAHVWPGGLALALHLAAHPGTARGRDVLDLGAGSGLAALAALRAGAASALAVDPDPLARLACGLNAEANGLRLRAVAPDDPEARAWLAPGRLVLAGDVFYDAAVAAASAAALDRAVAAGAEALVGDIGRAHLPRDRLEPLADWPVRDLGAAAVVAGHVGRWRP